MSIDLLFKEFSNFCLNDEKIEELFESGEFNPNYRHLETRITLCEKICSRRNIKFINIFVEKYLDSLDEIPVIFYGGKPGDYNYAKLWPHILFVSDFNARKILQKYLIRHPWSPTGRYMIELQDLSDYFFDAKKYQCLSFLIIEKNQYPFPSLQRRILLEMSLDNVQTFFKEAFDYLLAHPDFDWVKGWILIIEKFESVWNELPIEKKSTIVNRLLYNSNFEMPKSIKNIRRFIEFTTNLKMLKFKLFPLHSNPEKMKEIFPFRGITSEKFIQFCELLKCQICFETDSPGDMRHFACKTLMHQACLDKHLFQTPGELLICSKIKCPFCRINIENVVPKPQLGKVFVSVQEIEWIEANEPNKEHAVCEKCHCVFELGDRACGVNLPPPSSAGSLPPVLPIPKKCEACSPASKVFSCPNCKMQLQHRGGCTSFVCCYYGADGCRGDGSVPARGGCDPNGSAGFRGGCDHGASVLTTGNVVFCGHRFTIDSELRFEYGVEDDVEDDSDSSSDTDEQFGYRDSDSNSD